MINTKIKITKKKEDLYLVNNKTIYKDMNDKWCGRIKLTHDELLAFNDELISNKSINDIEVIDTQIFKPLKGIFFIELMAYKPDLNNFELEVLKFLRPYSRMVITKGNISKFKREVIFKIRQIANKKNEQLSKLYWQTTQNNDKFLLLENNKIEFKLKHGFIESEL